MIKMKKASCLSLLLFFIVSVKGNTLAQETYDICIYGGTSAGVIAAYTASNAGKSVLLVDPGKRLGGLSSGGLGYTDIGNKYVVKGLALDFYRKLGRDYDKFEQWIFEPSKAEAVFKRYMENSTVTVRFDHQLSSVTKNENLIEGITISNIEAPEDSSFIKAKVFLDCTYEGDLMAKAGVSYHVGREDNKVYGETLNGVQLMDGHQFPDGIDPYTVPGDKNSGLLWGISEGALLPNGTGDHKVQAYNYRITLTNVSENRIPIEKPENYDPQKYALLKRWKEKYPWKSLNDVFIWSLMPNGKTDINNRNGFSTDMIGMNWAYPEAGYKQRKEIIKAHEDYTKGLLYFVGHDPSVPDAIREQLLQWGYPKDEYIENDHWTPQLYIREARRMVGPLVMTQHHCQGREVVEDDIAYAAYTMDSHNCDRLVVNGMVKNEGNVEVGGFPPFPISYRAITPKKEQAANLLVPVCLSASHIAFGSIRMEPVFMVLGQSASVAACLAIDQGRTVQDIDVQEIKAILQQNPKADGRKADVLIDSQDDKAVQLSGNWEKEEKGGYGRTYLKASNTGSISSARFNAGALDAENYAIYTYFPKLEGGADQLIYKIFDGEQLTLKKIDLSSVTIEGQTSGDWLHLGDYAIPVGEKAYVEISTEGADGLVTANAVLFVPHDDQDNPKIK